MEATLEPVEEVGTLEKVEVLEQVSALEEIETLEEVEPAERANALEDPQASQAAHQYSPKELGRRGEEAATRFLQRRGFEIVERNWKCFAGEADIIAIHEGTLCFVEVKTRSDASKGFPSEAVNERKRDRYERIAACYLKEHVYDDIRVRFDVIAILVLNNERAFLRHHVNAFGSM